MLVITFVTTANSASSLLLQTWHLSLTRSTVTMSAPHPNLIVEELAQRRTRLECILEAHSVVLRKEPANLVSEAYERMQEGFAQPGDHWFPKDAAEKDKNVKRMEEICATTSTSIEA